MGRAVWGTVGGRRTRVAGVVAAIVATGACSASLTGRLDMTKIERSIREAASTGEFEGAEVAAVECPEERAYEADDEFTCTATIDGQAIDFVVTQIDGKGGVTYELAEGIVPVQLDEYEAVAVAFVRQNESADATARCGDGGKRFTFVDGPTEIICSAEYGGFARGVSVRVAATGVVEEVQFSQARLDTATAGERAVPQLVDELGGPFLLSCPDTFADDSTFVAFDPGDTFDCDALRDLAVVARVRITVDDVSGGLTAERL